MYPVVAVRAQNHTLTIVRLQRRAYINDYITRNYELTQKRLNTIMNKLGSRAVVDVDSKGICVYWSSLFM